MKKYAKAQMEIIAFETEDVISASGGVHNTETGTPGDGPTEGPDWGGPSDGGDA